MAELNITVRDPHGQATSRRVEVDVAGGDAAPAAPPSRDSGGPGRYTEALRGHPRRVAPMRRRVPMGRILVEAGLLSEAQLERALQQQKETGERLGRVIMSMGLASQEDIARAIAKQLGIDFVNLADVLLEEDVLLRVPEHIARRHHVIPISADDSSLVVGMEDPLDVVALDDLRKLTGLEIRPVVITPDAFQRALSQYPVGVDQTLAEIRPAETYEEEVATERLRAVAEDAPIVRLANQVIVQAIRQGASDIHVEPQEQRVRIRYRIDGALYSVMTPPKHVQAALVSRIKIMAGMNIAERRVPQDGRIEMRVDNRDIDLRVSTIPTVWGEKVVMRILDKQGAFVGIEKLGLLPEDHQRFERIITRPHGIILLTGPTGSGKTTTLYAILNRLNKVEVNITTIEDPVEYQLPGIAQVQINPKAGLTFATGLRAFLRQDPDIIMVGEIRDEETARIAIHASLTGHLVLSTLHTNDAAGAVTRLVDMEIEPFLVSSSVIGVIAQRLVRVLCQHCKQSYVPTPEMLKRVGLADLAPVPTFYRATGCEYCSNIGYRGRTGLFEIMPVDDTIKGLIVDRAPSGRIKEAAIAAGMRTLQTDGLAKVLNGTTSLEEVLRVVFVEE
ncbi:MAG: type II secretion system ATPase GspE [Armatimonadota bacterium]|nr:type II secretion system ATPase GspE [Armatimonadota bacterium]MDR7427656.1 type II secretion system ATPase GspE [Armatimonadota bacterium]MDR7470175.1 type II secretion system ATPase GspE [Armatimonadota bacterium]MDR7473603.1 type II secretion system ATPase GspE [Armatimonadota bacterium]MDR7538876.1 type II secretion system ATPase GspE [Armatimonadota bacterium]